MAGTEVYSYNPSVAATIIFSILFGALASITTYQTFRTRTWFMIPFVVGTFFEFAGYITRIVSAQQTPNWSIGPFIVQYLLILVAPALFAAGIYMELGRIILLVHGEKHSVISRRWLTKIFVAEDVISFFTQVIGAGNMAGRTTAAINRGQTIILIGLVLQVVSFLFFIITAAVFHLRLRRNPTQKLLIEPNIPWQKHMFALYATSLLILIRCVFRLIEYTQGRDGTLMVHEIFLYLFDSILMLGTVLIFIVIHPSEVNALLKGHGAKAIRNVVKIYTV